MTAPNASSSLPPEPTTLSQEIQNRFVALPADQKRDVCLALVKLAVEVTREFMQHSPSVVDEFLAFERATRRRRRH